MRPVPWPTRRQANLLLLAAVAVALGTGTWAFATGGPAARVVAVAHGVAGLVVVVLAPRKRRTVTAGLARARTTRWVSVSLLVATSATVLTGVLHSGGVRAVAGVPTMHVHVYAAITAGVGVVWHAIARPARPVRADLSRRSAVRAGLVALAAGFGYAFVDGSVRVLGFPGGRRRGTGSHEVASGDPARMPTTIWSTDAVPDLDRRTYRLRVGGQPVTLPTPADPAVEVWEATLDCTSGWCSTQRWGGVPVEALLGDPPPDAGSILVTSVTGYSRRFPVADVGRLLVATSVGGEPLTDGHGGPARLVAPGRRGFWWVKWLEHVTYDDAPPWAQPPFPLL